MRVRLLSLWTLATPLIASAADFAIPLGNRGELHITLPDRWKATIRAPDRNLPPTVSITKHALPRLEGATGPD